MILIFTFLAGLAIGSFINVVVHRLHKRSGGMFTGRSRCVHCHHALAAGDLIPLISFLLLRGACRYCRRPINIHYPLVELVTGITFVLIVANGMTIPFTTEVLGAVLLWLVYATVLITVATYDVLYGEIPDRIMFPALFIGLALMPLSITPSPARSIFGALVPTIFFASLVLVSGGRWMGGGDIRLGAFIGLILGWPYVLVALACAYVTGSVVGIALLASGTVRRGDRMPFGPFLVLGTLFAILWGDSTVEWYLTLLRLPL